MRRLSVAVPSLANKSLQHISQQGWGTIWSRRVVSLVILLVAIISTDRITNVTWPLKWNFIFSSPPKKKKMCLCLLPFEFLCYCVSTVHNKIFYSAPPWAFSIMKFPVNCNASGLQWLISFFFLPKQLLCAFGLQQNYVVWEQLEEQIRMGGNTRLLNHTYGIDKVSKVTVNCWLCWLCMHH